jgi:site-specific recombinase XerD
LEPKAKGEHGLPATGDRYIALVKLVCRLAERNRKIKTNPARLLRIRKENNARIRYLNQHKPAATEIRYLIHCTDEESRLRAVIEAEYAHHLSELEISLNTGMRRSEQYSLMWSDVDLTHRILKIRMSKHAGCRYVPLNPTVTTMPEFLQAKATEMERHKAHGSQDKAKDSGYVFLNVAGNNPLVGTRHWFEDAVKKAHISHFTWHDLRHTFASRLAMRESICGEFRS